MPMPAPTKKTRSQVTAKREVIYNFVASRNGYPVTTMDLVVQGIDTRDAVYQDMIWLCKNGKLQRGGGKCSYRAFYLLSSEMIFDPKYNMTRHLILKYFFERPDQKITSSEVSEIKTGASLTRSGALKAMRPIIKDGWIIANIDHDQNNTYYILNIEKAKQFKR